MTIGKYIPASKKYPDFLPAHHHHLRQQPDKHLKPTPCKCGCGEMTSGLYNWHTGKHCEYKHGHQQKELKNKGWSRDYAACINCGTTKTPYGRKGLCQNCEYHLLRKNDPKQRAKRSEYFHNYYVNKKRDSGYYEKYRRSQSYKLKEILRRRTKLDDPDYELFQRNRFQLIVTENRPCEVCGLFDRREADHILDRHKGGTSEISNLRVLCFVHHRKAGSGRHSLETTTRSLNKSLTLAVRQLIAERLAKRGK